MIHRGESHDIYHARQAVSAGFLWDIVKPGGCPAQAWHDSAFNPKRIINNSHEFDIGRAAHLLGLEAEEYVYRIEQIPFKNYQTQKARELRDQAYADSKVPLTLRETELVLTMRRALENSDAAELVFGDAGENELSYTWECGSYLDREASSEQDGRIVAKFGRLEAKARADRVLHGSPQRGNTMLIDLKTAISASPDAFQRAMIRDGHHLRAAWYLDGWNACQGPDLRIHAENPFNRVEGYVFVVVAKTPPHLVGIYEVGPRSLEWGRTLYRDALRKVRRARESGVWAGYSREPQRSTIVELPAFAENMLIARERAGEFDVGDPDSAFVSEDDSEAIPY